MKGTLAVLRRELSANLESPVAWVTAITFVAALHALFYFLGYPIGDLALPGLWEGRVSSLQPLFAWMPLLLAVLVPALTMGAWAEERRAGTDELLLTLPIPARSAVLGKFLASWALLVFILAATVLPLAAVVAGLGPLDWGAALGGLIGAAALGASYVALGLFVSSLTQEQLVAFIVTALLLGTLWSTSLFVRVLPAAVADWIYYASPSTHYLESAARGVFDLRDLVFLGTATLLFLVLNSLAVDLRRWR